MPEVTKVLNKHDNNWYFTDLRWRKSKFGKCLLEVESNRTVYCEFKANNVKPWKSVAHISLYIHKFINLTHPKLKCEY